MIGRKSEIRVEGRDFGQFGKNFEDIDNWKRGRNSETKAKRRAPRKTTNATNKFFEI